MKFRLVEAHLSGILCIGGKIVLKYHNIVSEHDFSFKQQFSFCLLLDLY